MITYIEVTFCSAGIWLAVAELHAMTDITHRSYEGRFGLLLSLMSHPGSRAAAAAPVLCEALKSMGLQTADVVGT